MSDLFGSIDKLHALGVGFLAFRLLADMLLPTIIYITAKYFFVYKSYSIAYTKDDFIKAAPTALVWALTFRIVDPSDSVYRSVLVGHETGFYDVICYLLFVAGGPLVLAFFFNNRWKRGKNTLVSADAMENALVFLRSKQKKDIMVIVTLDDSTTLRGFMGDGSYYDEITKSLYVSHTFDGVNKLVKNREGL